MLNIEKAGMPAKIGIGVAAVTVIAIVCALIFQQYQRYNATTMTPLGGSPSAAAAGGPRAGATPLQSASAPTQTTFPRKLPAAAMPPRSR